MPDATASDPRIQSLMKDTARMMDELAQLSRQLGEVGRRPAEAGGDVVGELHDQFKALQERLKGFSEDSKQTLSGVDHSVRSNPYVFILCALGLGFLLGKAKRS